MTKELVVAKYKEDISWIGHSTIQSTYDKIYVYDKSLPDNYFKDNVSIYGGKVTLTSLPNIDREASTYLYHIITNYHCLSDVVTFAQGNPFDHCKNFLNRVKEIDSELNRLAKYSINGKDPYLYYGDTYVCDADGAPNHIGLEVGRYFRSIFSEKHETPKEFKFSAGAQFSIASQLITSKPKSFYIKLHDIMWWGKEYADVPVAPYYVQYQNGSHSLAAWAYERLWPYIFTIKDD